MNNDSTLTRLTIFSLIALFLAVGAASATDAEDLASQMDEMFADWVGDDRPGAAVAVIRDGEIVYQNGFGMADLERGVPITPASAFEIGSISKQFTAMSVLLLENDGLLVARRRHPHAHPGNARLRDSPSPSGICCITPVASAT